MHLLLLLACGDPKATPSDDTAASSCDAGMHLEAGVCVPDDTATPTDDADGDGVLSAEDCDDDDPSVGAATERYTDGDGDGYGDDTSAALSCDSAGTVAVGGDCADDNLEVYPGASETDCTDPTDYNCDGVTVFTDTDGDGSAACVDCDDNDPAARPDGTEVCGGSDEDCDGLLDDADDSLDAGSVPVWYRDWDGDGYANEDEVSLTQCAEPTGYASATGDCDNYDGLRSPGVPEVCDPDDVDEDCDGSADDADASVDSSTWVDLYADADSDGHGDLSRSIAACDVVGGYVIVGDDCEDADASIHPGASEVCDGLDGDCDGAVDEEALDEAAWYLDIDGDGYGDAGSVLLSCSTPAGYVADASDCLDTDASVSPAGAEQCDGVDQDCDGVVDEAASDAVIWYADTDSDGYGNVSQTVADCVAPTGYVSDASDCDDTRADTNPGATEICDGSGLDEDCDGASNGDDPSATGAAIWYVDADGDGYGSAGTTVSACDQPAGYAATTDDCDDSDTAAHPGALEVCDPNDVDEDCDGMAEESDASGMSTWYADADGDGFGDAASPVTDCAAPSGYVADGTDCDDTDTNTNTSCGGSYTVCDDGVAPYTDIQDAVNDAADGDVITVCAGIYDYVEIDRDDVTIEGSDGADVTIIDGGTHPAVYLDGVTVTLRGLTLTGTTSVGSAAALHAVNTTLTVEDVIVAGCDGASTGSGVLVDGGSSSWTDVDFVDNSGTGGALFYATDNTGLGGSVTMTRVVFRDNIVGYLFDAGRVDLVLQNSLFYANTTLSNREPINFYPGSSSQWVLNNTFYGTVSPYREVIYQWSGLEFVNNIVAENSGQVTSTSAATNDYNTYYNNGYNNVYYYGGAEAHSLTSDPKLIDPENGDLRLDPSFSPCVNAGNPLSGYNDADGSRNDMGAYGGPSGSW